MALLAAQLAWHASSYVAYSAPNRVDIVYEASRLEPRQLQALFEANLPLLLEVFNPQGWCAPFIHLLLFSCLFTLLIMLCYAC